MRNRWILQGSMILLPLMVWIVSPGIRSHASEQVSGFQKRLRRQVSMVWKGQTLRGALASLSDHGRLCVWLDRRVDPEQSIALVLRDVPREQVFEKLAEICNLQVAYLESVIYLGPGDAVDELMALREKLHEELAHSSRSRMPGTLRRYWLSRSEWSWPRLSEPRELLRDLFTNTPIKLRDAERVPYDLWDARQLPRMTKVDQVTLLLIGFHQTLQIDPDGRQCRVLPIESPVLITRRYPFPANPERTLARLRRQFPGLRIELRRAVSMHATLSVTGVWSKQQQFRQALEGRSNVRHESDDFEADRSMSHDRKIYSLEIREQTLRDVLQQLKSQLSVELTWDERQLANAGHSLDTRISCKVQSASLEQLLEAVLAPAGLHYRYAGRKIRIYAAP